MTRHLRSLILLLPVSWLLGNAWNSDLLAQASARLIGIVTDPAGRPIADALVVATPVSPTSPSAQELEASSDGAGQFAVTLAPGSYRLKISHESFITVEQVVDLTASSTDQLALRLQLAPLASTVVVTAQALPAEVAQTPAPVTEISSQQIAQREMTSVPDLLATETGFSLSRTGPEGGLASLFLDGGNSNYTKVLVDGVPANESGGTIDFSNFSLDGVDKIEVVHGAESALYGSDAVTGVIQIFTHRGDTSTPELDLTADGGSFDTGHGAAQFSGLLGPLDYSVLASYFSTAGRGPNDALLNRTLSGNFGWKFSDTDGLRFTLRDNSSFAGIPGPTLYLPPVLNQSSILHDFFAGLVWNAQTGKHWVWHVAGTESSLHNIQSDLPSFISIDQFNRASFDGQASYIFRQTTWTAGYYYEVENGFPGALEGEHARRNNQAGYLDLRWQPLERLTFNAGARAEDNASFGTRVVPRAGVAYLLRAGSGSLGPTRIHAFYGQGIDEPELDESFGTDPCFPGNPNLAPEQSRTASAGLQQQFASGRVLLNADYFYNDFHDIISFAFSTPTAACPFGTGTYFNTDLARARGLNLSGELHLTRWLHLSGHYTYDDSRVLRAPNATDPTETAGNRLLRRPVNSGTVVLDAVWRRADLNIVGYITGVRTDSDFLGLGYTRNPGYSRFDVAGSYRLYRHASVFLRAGNVLNRQYQDALGYPALGREVRGGVKVQLGGGEKP
jgi:vitamin B12 transporter